MHSRPSFLGAAIHFHPLAASPIGCQRMFGFAAPCQYAEEALSGFRHFFLCEFGNSLIISISVFNPGTPMTKQEYVVFWHADSAEYADCFCICGICEICVGNCQGSSSRHLLSKLCDSLIIFQCGCPYNENRKPFNELHVFRGNWFDISRQLSRYIEPTVTIYRVNCHTL